MRVFLLGLFVLVNIAITNAVCDVLGFGLRITVYAAVGTTACVVAIRLLRFMTSTERAAVGLGKASTASVDGDGAEEFAIATPASSIRSPEWRSAFETVSAESYVALLKKERRLAKDFAEAREREKRLTASIGLGGLHLLASGDSGAEHMVTLARSTRSSIELRSPDLPAQSVLHALLLTRRRGQAVRILLDRRVVTSSGSRPMAVQVSEGGIFSRRDNGSDFRSSAPHGTVDCRK